MVDAGDQWKQKGRLHTGNERDLLSTFGFSAMEERKSICL